MDDLKNLSHLVRFVADEMESGRYEADHAREDTTLRELFPHDEGDDPEDQVDELAYSYTNDNGVITLFVRIRQK